jgi:hypothetical protein
MLKRKHFEKLDDMNKYLHPSEFLDDAPHIQHNSLVASHRMHGNGQSKSLHATPNEGVSQQLLHNNLQSVTPSDLTLKDGSGHEVNAQILKIELYSSTSLH